MKPENLFLSPELHITVFDFGLARPLGAPTAAAWIGTPRYAAPEQGAAGLRLTAAADLYSLGVVLLDLLEPRRAAESKEPPDLAPPADAPRAARELIRRLTAREPLRRPSAEEAAGVLLELEIGGFATR
mgnify:CR=1 FL=1